MKKPYILVEQGVVDKAFADVCGRLTAPRTLIPLLALALPLAACLPIEQACTDEARVSVSVEVVDEAGEAVADALVAYDGGEGEIDCEGWEDVYSCGYEVDGEIDIIVSAPGFEEQVVTVTVESDECHVISQDLVVELIEVQP